MKRLNIEKIIGIGLIGGLALFFVSSKSKAKAVVIPGSTKDQLFVEVPEGSLIEENSAGGLVNNVGEIISEVITENPNVTTITLVGGTTGFEPVDAHFDVPSIVQAAEETQITTEEFINLYTYGTIDPSIPLSIPTVAPPEGLDMDAAPWLS